MAIVKTDPNSWEKANVVLIDSDAASNDAALLDIENWAAQHGFARVNEFWLRQIRINGARVFRGICYRLSEEITRSNDEASRAVDQAVAQMPVTPHTARLDR